MFLKDYMELSGDEVILDIACGTGELERILVNNYPNLNIIGVDISEKMLDVAKSKFPNSQQIEFLKASANSLPFPDSSFDTIISASAFHYFNNPVNALQEMKRVLKPNGKVIIMDWCRDFWFCQILDLFLKLTDPAHKNCHTQQELHNFLNKTDFQVTRQERTRPHLLWGLMIATGTP
jgi:ubiquinone/menaquinone biosynthesis C-methylase UbiE